MTEITLQETKELGEINKHNLDGENLKQPQYVWMVSQELAAANYRKGIAELDRELFYAKMDKEIRDSVPDGEKKPSEVAIKLEITRMSKMRRAEEELLQAALEADQWYGAFESIKARGFALQRLGDLYAANYFSSETGGHERSNARETRAEYVRQEQAKLRREKEKRKS